MYAYIPTLSQIYVILAWVERAARTNEDPVTGFASPIANMQEQLGRLQDIRTRKANGREMVYLAG